MRIPKWFEEWFCKTAKGKGTHISRESWFSALEVAWKSYKKGERDVTCKERL